VKTKLVTALFLVISMLVLFTGCEAMPSLSAIVSTTKGYNDELIALVLAHMVGNTPADFVEDSTIPIDDGITCTIDYTDADEVQMLLNLDSWVASDGTEISGVLEMEIGYYASPMYVSSISTEMGLFYFDRTSILFATEIFDGDASAEAFTAEDRFFACISLIVDGKTLINTIQLGR